MNGWGKPWEVAATLGVPTETVRTWAKRGRIRSVCALPSRHVLVSWHDAYDLATQASKPQRVAA